MAGKRRKRTDPGDGSPDFAEHELPYGERLPRRRYERELRALQIELVKLQYWVKNEGEKVAVVFEGRDGAGKGGSIKRFTQYLNPRGARVVALPKPTEVERSQWYFQRYVAHLPSGGEVVFFDRSWYNRAGVERVMGFCSQHEYVRFLQEAPGFEQSLVASGVRLFKLWFTVGREEQRRRIESRESDPLRVWKRSPMDDASMERFDLYTQARDAIFAYTDSAHAPWIVVNSNEKRRARLEAIRHVLHGIPYHLRPQAEKDEKVARAPDPRVVRPAAELIAPP